MKHLSKLMLTLTILSASALNDGAKGQSGHRPIDLENMDYCLNVVGFYSEALLVATSRDNHDSIKDVSVTIEHPAEVLRNSSLMYQIDTLTSRKSDRGILHPEILVYTPVMWQSESVEARFGDYDFECVKMAASSDGRLLLVSARTEADKEATEALRQLFADKYGDPAYRKSKFPNEQCRWQTDDEYIQLEIREQGDEFKIEIFRWQKKNSDLLATYRLFKVFFEQEGSNFYPI